eukprot:PhM_4_TR6949/c0_g1_i1/m.76453
MIPTEAFIITYHDSACFTDRFFFCVSSVRGLIRTRVVAQMASGRLPSARAAHSTRSKTGYAFSLMRHETQSKLIERTTSLRKNGDPNETMFMQRTSAVSSALSLAWSFAMCLRTPLYRRSSQTCRTVKHARVESGTWSASRRARRDRTTSARALARRTDRKLLRAVSVGAVALDDSSTDEPEASSLSPPLGGIGDTVVRGGVRGDTDFVEHAVRCRIDLSSPTSLGEMRVQDATLYSAWSRMISWANVSINTYVDVCRCTPSLTMHDQRRCTVRSSDTAVWRTAKSVVLSSARQRPSRWAIGNGANPTSSSSWPQRNARWACGWPHRDTRSCRSCRLRSMCSGFSMSVHGAISACSRWPRKSGSAMSRGKTCFASASPRSAWRRCQTRAYI